MPYRTFTRNYTQVNSCFWCLLFNRAVRNATTQKRSAIPLNCHTPAAVAWKSSSRGTVGPVQMGDAAGLTGLRRHLCASDAETARSSAGWWWWSSLASVTKTAPTATRRQLPATDVSMMSTNWKCKLLNSSGKEDPSRAGWLNSLHVEVADICGMNLLNFTVHDFAS